MLRLNKNLAPVFEQGRQIILDKLIVLGSNYPTVDVPRTEWIDMLLSKVEQKALMTVQGLRIPVTLAASLGYAHVKAPWGGSDLWVSVSASDVPLGSGVVLMERCTLPAANKFFYALSEKYQETMNFMIQMQAIGRVVPILLQCSESTIENLLPDLNVLRKQVWGSSGFTNSRLLLNTLNANNKPLGFDRHPRFTADLDLSRPILGALALSPDIKQAPKVTNPDIVNLSPVVEFQTDTDKTVRTFYKAPKYSLED